MRRSNKWIGFAVLCGWICVGPSTPINAAEVSCPAPDKLFDDQGPLDPVPESFCETKTVTCPAYLDVESQQAEIRRTEPAGGPTAGTVVLVSGGSGTAWYADKPNTAEEPVARNVIVAELIEAGYQAIEYKWLGGGWLDSVEGLDPAELNWQGLSTLSCRVERLIRYIKTNRHSSGPFCGTGQSGGAVQLAYTVAHHGLDTKWDSLVLTSGPPLNDLVFGCDEASPCEQDDSALGCFRPPKECLVDQAFGNTSLNCKADLGSGPCQEAPLDPNWVLLATSDSLVKASGDYDYPFAVHFVFGEEDNAEAPPQGLMFWNMLTSSGTETGCRSLPNISHGVPWGDDADGNSSIAGAATIRDLLLEYCVDSPPAIPFSDLDKDCSTDFVDVVPCPLCPIE